MAFNTKFKRSTNIAMLENSNARCMIKCFYMGLSLVKDSLTLGKSCSFGLLCVSFMNLYQFACVLLSLLVLRLGCGI